MLEQKVICNLSQNVFEARNENQSNNKKIVGFLGLEKSTN